MWAIPPYPSNTGNSQLANPTIDTQELNVVDDAT